MRGRDTISFSWKAGEAALEVGLMDGKSWPSKQDESL